MKRILPVVVLGALVAPVSSPAQWEAEIGDFHRFECNTPDGKRLKPKFGNIDGVLYVDLPALREDCHAAVTRRISQCGQNTSFASNTKNREYPDCLLIFEKQARECEAFFRAERPKCDTGAAGAEAGDEAGQAEGEGNWGLVGGDRYTCTEPGDSSASLTWAGRCAGGVPVGEGVAGNAEGLEASGAFADGLLEGRWVLRWPNGTVKEGPFVNGKQNGDWVERFAGGHVHKGPYVDGKRNGHWVERDMQSDDRRVPFLVSEGPYVDGKKTGHWVERFSSGRVAEGLYVDGKENGRWNATHPDGSPYEICFRTGEKVDC